MAAKHQKLFVMNARIELISIIIRDSRFSQALRLELKSENPMADGVWYRFHHGTTFTSWGEKITITLKRINEVSTSLDIHSECGMPTQIIDWGKNRQNVCNIYEYIERELKRGANYAQAASALPNASATYVSSEATVSFCSQCGSRVTPNDNFCTKCGNKIR